VAWDDRAIFREGLIGAEQAVLDQLSGATVYHIDLQISGDFLLLQGREEVRYTNQEDEPLDEVYFRLFPNIAGGAATVSAVKADDQDVEPVYEFQDSALRVPLPAALQPGEQAVIQVDFEVEVAQEMGGNYGLFGYFDGVLVLDEFYPVIPVYDDEGWNVEVPPPDGDVTHFDASFYLVRVTAPANLTVVASGVKVGREYEGDKQVLTFAAGPARDFYLAASENYTVVSETVGETTVNSYTFSEWTDGARLTLQFVAGALNSFNERFGVYPYTEFDVVSTPMLAQGMEYPGIVAISLNLYDPEAVVSGLPSRVMLESVIAHETAHQWFYNAVGNDQVDEAWLDEALVQYATGLYYEDVHGKAAAQEYRGSWDYLWGRIGRADSPIGLSSGAYADGVYYPTIYGRGPLFVAALAKEMGREPFDEFLHDYYTSHKWRIGTSDAFRQLAEHHCQCDLTAMFEEWVYEAPTPAQAPQPAGDGVVNGWAVLAERDYYGEYGMSDLPVDYINISRVHQLLLDLGWQENHIRELREFSQQDLREALEWLTGSAGEDDVVYFHVSAHGLFLHQGVHWSTFFPANWAEVPSQRRVLVVNSCRAAIFTGAVNDDPRPHLSVAATGKNEDGWAGLEEEGLPIIGEVFTYYFVAAFGEPDADADGNGAISIQEATLYAEAQQRTYMHEVVFAVPEFLEMFQKAGFPTDDPEYPHVVMDDAIGEPIYLGLDTQ